jgi:tRNA threonylcarbamoyl adenosine modification protein YeaZ
MIILAIDTTTHFGSVALVSETGVLAEVNYASPSSHSRQVFQAVDEVLKIVGENLDNLDGLAVAAGPGSFTGIRIGLSLVKALALASKKPVAAVSSLEALAQKLVLPGVNLIVPMLDARKGEIFGCAYKVAGLDLEEIIQPAAYNPEAFLQILPEDSFIHLIGTGVDLYWPLIIEKLGQRAKAIDRTYYLAAEVGKLGGKILKEGRGLSPDQLEPIYYRKSQAEEKKSGRTE